MDHVDRPSSIALTTFVNNNKIECRVYSLAGLLTKKAIVTRSSALGIAAGARRVTQPGAARAPANAVLATDGPSYMLLKKLHFHMMFFFSIWNYEITALNM